MGGIWLWQVHMQFNGNKPKNNITFAEKNPPADPTDASNCEVQSKGLVITRKNTGKCSSVQTL